MSREGLVLAALGLAAGVLFIVTSAVVERHHASWEAMGKEWFARGEAALAAGRPEEAREALRTALVYERDNARYYFRLAQALVAEGRTVEARSYLRGLEEREPGNGPVQLELARLSARAGDTAAAAGHYRAAIQALWEDEPDERRLQLRLELARMLVEQGAPVEAQSELIAAAARLPAEDAALQARVGELFRRAGDSSRALDHFRAALRTRPDLAPALLGAGRTAYARGEWRRAVTYLRRAVRALPGDSFAAEMLETAEAALAADPFLDRLTPAERSRRAARAFQQSRARLEACRAESTAPDLETLAGRLESRAPDATARALQRNPDRLEPTMELVFAAQRAAAARCGAPEGADRALLLLADSHEAES